MSVPPRIKLAVTVWAALGFAALMASYFVFRPVRDTLILENNLEDIPWVWLGTFVVVSVVSPLWSKLLARQSRPRMVPVAFHVFAVCTVGFFLVVRAELAPIAVGRVFYVWSAVFNLFVVSVFWSLLADLMGPATARQLYGPIAAGGTIGAIVGPVLTKGLVGTIGNAGVLLMSGVLLEIAVFAVYRLRTAAKELPSDSSAEHPDAPAGGGAFTGIAHVAKSPYLSAIVGYVLCTACAATFLYLAQFEIVQASITDRVERTQYFATVELWTNIATLVLQTVVVGPALGRFGPAVVLAVLPLAQAVGIPMVTAAPSLMLIAVFTVITRSATHGLTRPARELLFTVVSRDDKYRAKHAIDTVAYRFGDLATSWLRKGLVALTAGGGAIIVAALSLAAIWIGLAVALGIGFRRRDGKDRT